MGRTLLNGAESLLAASVTRNLLNVSVSGSAVIAKAVAGSNITLSQTGADAGTGDVTFNLASSPTVSGTFTAGGLTVSGATSLGATSVSGALNIGASTAYYSTGAGAYFGFNSVYNSGFKSIVADYGYYIRHDGADLGFYAAPSVAAGAAQSPIQVMTINASGAIGTTGALNVGGVLTMAAAPILSALSGLVLGQGATAAKAVSFTPATITVTGANTLAALPTAYQGLFFLLTVNGQAFLPVGSSPPFTVSGTTITWSAANASVALATGDLVQVLYI